MENGNVNEDNAFAGCHTGSGDSRFAIHDSRTAEADASAVNEAWAREWCVGVARWRTVRHRWGVRGRRTLVRVAGEAPLGCLREVLGFLSSEAGARGVFVDGKEVGDWAPMGAWYEEVRAEDGTQAVTVRVFQALRGAEDGEADGPFLVEDGCVWRVSHTFYWAVGEVPEVPAGSSGVSYALQGLRRDDETGLYDCVLVRRERVPVEVGPWASHLDVYRERETALLLGVRDDGEGSVDEKVAGFLGEHDLPLAAGDGKVLDVGKRKNEDCTTDVTVEVTAEVGVPEASVVVAEDSFARRVTVVDRGQEVEAGEPMLGGESRSERTAGGRFDNTVVTVTPKEVPEAAVEGTRTLYEVEERVEDRNVTPPPEGGAATAGGAGDVPADVDGVEYPGDYAGNDPASADGEPGRIVRVGRRLTAEGNLDVTVATRVERPVEEAEKVSVASALGGTERVTHRNQSEAKAAELAGGARAQGEVRRVTVGKTPGNLRDVTVEVVRAKAVAAGGSCARTVFEHGDTEVARNQAKALGEAPEAGGGKTYRNVSRLNEDGTFDTEASVTEELAVADAGSTSRPGALEAASEKVGRNLGSEALGGLAPGADFVSGAASPAEGEVTGRLGEVADRKTPGGRTDRTVTALEAKFSHRRLQLWDGPQQERYTVGSFANAPWAFVEGLGAKVDQLSFRKNRFGLFDGGYREVAFRAGASREVRVEPGFDVEHTVRTWCDAAKIVWRGEKAYKVTREYTANVGRCKGLTDAWNHAPATLAATPRIQVLAGDWVDYVFVSKVTETHEELPFAAESGLATATWGA